MNLTKEGVCMNCPYCEKEMELGYIQCRDGLHWTSKKVFAAALSGFGKDCISLENGAGRNNTVVYAYKCSECKKVIIDYTD